MRENGALITLHLVYDYPGATNDFSDIEFSSVVLYDFTHTGCAIISGIFEVPILPLVIENQAMLAKWWKNFGGLKLWNDDFGKYGAKLESEGYRAWLIESAIGFAGFIIGKEIKQLNPIQQK